MPLHWWGHFIVDLGRQASPLLTLPCLLLSLLAFCSAFLAFITARVHQRLLHYIQPAAFCGCYIRALILSHIWHCHAFISSFLSYFSCDVHLPWNTGAGFIAAPQVHLLVPVSKIVPQLQAVRVCNPIVSGMIHNNSGRSGSRCRTALCGLLIFVSVCLSADNTWLRRLDLLIPYDICVGWHADVH